MDKGTASLGDGAPEPGRNRWAGAGAAVALIVLIVFADALEGSRPQYVGLLVSAPLLAASFVRPAPTAAVGVVALGAAAAYGAYEGIATAAPQLVRMVAIAAAAALAVAAAALRVRSERRMGRLSLVAALAQQAVLRPLPDRLGPVVLAGRYASATAEATVGGDFYDAVDTAYGARLLVGDVRGKGLEAVRLTGQVLGSFRHVAASPPDAADVLRELDRALTSVSGDEDFATAMLVQLRRSPEGVRAEILSAGHPPPLLVRGGRARPVDLGEPSPPLGLGAQPSRREVLLTEGDALVLYTDGLSEARRQGQFLPLESTVGHAVADRSPGDAVATLHAALLDWAGGRLADDVALVVLRPADAPVEAAEAAQSARGTERSTSLTFA